MKIYSMQTSIEGEPGQEQEEKVNDSSSTSSALSSDDEEDLLSPDFELEAVDNQTNRYIKTLLADTQKNSRLQKEKSESKIMHGRSLYGFPTIETLEKHNEVAAQTNLETSIAKRFDTSPSQLGLAMVD